MTDQEIETRPRSGDQEKDARKESQWFPKYAGGCAVLKYEKRMKVKEKQSDVKKESPERSFSFTILFSLRTTHSLPAIYFENKIQIH